MSRFKGATRHVMLTPTHYFTAPADLQTCSTADLLLCWRDLIRELASPLGFMDAAGYQFLEAVRREMFDRNYRMIEDGGGFLLTPVFPDTLRSVAAEIDQEIADEKELGDNSEDDEDAWSNAPD